jgi:hypothetical protein
LSSVFKLVFVVLNGFRASNKNGELFSSQSFIFFSLEIFLFFHLF